MKKTLIAAASLCVVAASYAESSVTVYGVADVWIGRESQVAPNASQTVIDSDGVSDSRVGFYGVEELGAGLQAKFLLEQSFRIDSGATSNNAAEQGNAFNRQAYLAFTSSTGEVRIGKTFTPFDDISGHGHAAFDSIFSPQEHVWVSTSYMANPANTVYYATPNLGGFSAALSMSLGEDKDNPNTGKASAVNSVSAQYADGPLYVGMAYQAERGQGDGATTVKYFRFNTTYDLEVAKVLFGYGRTQNMGFGFSGAWDLPSQNALVKDWELGIDVPMSSDLVVSGGIAGSSDNAAALTNNQSRRGYGVAAAYTLSKRTMVYGGYQLHKTKDDNNTDSVSAHITGMGVRHAF
ncbi:porin [Candidatus Symbiobacter mobilis]|uniref:Outer membrane protein n=1 Tax=Candidatus Symbiobacter mobilis CR TaxID=946483 RepID=U5N583_9BURK|nr:porin [Candidatus Symbiobacter mobilis]AGX86681.1 outer membrane protein [Candidatus Symbiobacter mobilis CR]